MSHSLAGYRDIWKRKPVLRAIYSDIYRRMLVATVPGLILEIGGGSGNFKAFSPDTISSDICFTPWLDLVCDAQKLPFPDDSISNVVMVDVLHHVEFPIHALREFDRVLRPGGRLIFCEPCITPLSGIFYRLFHEEPVDMTADPLIAGEISPDKDPWESNQGIPSLLVGRFRQRLAKKLPRLSLRSVERFSFLAYPLSGGFKEWSLLPAFAVQPLLSSEWAVRNLLGHLGAFRLLAVYEQVGQN